MQKREGAGRGGEATKDEDGRRRGSGGATAEREKARLVHEEFPWQVRNALQPPIDEQLRGHHDKATAVHQRHERLEDP